MSHCFTFKKAFLLFNLLFSKQRTQKTSFFFFSHGHHIKRWDFDKNKKKYMVLNFLAVLGIKKIQFFLVMKKTVKINVFKERNDFRPKKVYWYAFQTFVSPSGPLETAHDVFCPLDTGDMVALEGDGFIEHNFEVSSHRVKIMKYTNSKMFMLSLENRCIFPLVFYVKNHLLC